MNAGRSGVLQQLSRAVYRRLGLGRPQLRCRSSSTLLDRAAPHLPRVLQPSTWQSIIPPAIRAKTKELFQTQKKPTNPATYFIWIYLLIGSQAMRILQAKTYQKTFMRKADLQIEKLREVVRKLQAGEEVDVEKALGTGVPEEEAAWEEALREIEMEEQLWNQNKKTEHEAREQRKREVEEQERLKQDASPVNQSVEMTKVVDTAIPTAQPLKNPIFY